ncbi:MAG: alpha/beta fold hydrolase [Polyangiaceae bacterium]|nr:alpha/beta fold hydrolase [Polyangiaceae bacterium]
MLLADAVEVPAGLGVLRGWSFGEGPAVLLVHGWGGRGAQLRGFIEPLVSRGRRVVLFDAPGHGARGTGTSSLPQIGAAVAAMLAAIGPVAGVIAHSMGGPATALALERSRLRPRLAFIAPPAELKNATRRGGGGGGGGGGGQRDGPRGAAGRGRARRARERREPARDARPRPRAHLEGQGGDRARGELRYRLRLSPRLYCSSYAPASQGPTRGIPRWSTSGHSSETSTAGLPAVRAMVGVGPPLSASGASPGSAKAMPAAHGRSGLPLFLVAGNCTLPPPSWKVSWHASALNSFSVVLLANTTFVRSTLPLSPLKMTGP